MTDKKLKVGNTAYTELSIQIAGLEAKLDKVLQLLLEQHKPYIINKDFLSIGEGVDIEEFKKSFQSLLLATVLTNEQFDQEFK